MLPPDVGSIYGFVNVLAMEERREEIIVAQLSLRDVNLASPAHSLHLFI